MRAKFLGRCPRTGLQIRVGDEVVSNGRGGWELPASDPRLQPAPMTLEQAQRHRIKSALRRRPDLTNGRS
jgi:hypothetical protein